MATRRHILWSSALLLAILYINVKTIQSAPSPNTPVDATVNQNQASNEPAAQLKLATSRQQNTLLTAVGGNGNTAGVVAPTSLQVPAQAFSQPDGNTEGSMAVETLEENDGMDMPPQIHQYVTEYFFKEMVDEQDLVAATAGRQKRSAVKSNIGYGSYGQNYGSGYGNGYGQTSGNYGNQYGYGNLGNSYGTGKVSYTKGYTKSPIITFVKGFKPGKIYVDKGYVIRNYFRHGTYQIALQHYKLIPSVKVIPYTTYKQVGIGENIQAKYKYKAVICKTCYHGYPKIDVYENKKPYSYVARRFVYLPNQYNLNNYGGQQSYGNNNYGTYGNTNYGTYGNTNTNYGTYGTGTYGNTGTGSGYGTNTYNTQGQPDFGYDKRNGYSTTYDYVNQGYGTTNNGYGTNGYNSGYGTGTNYGTGNYGTGNYGTNTYGTGTYGTGTYGSGTSGTNYGSTNYGTGNYGTGTYGTGTYGTGTYGTGTYGSGTYGSNTGSNYGNGNAKVTYHSYLPKENWPTTNQG